MKPESEIPGDAEGGMFGLRRVLEDGPPPKAPADRSRLVAALITARLRKRPRRGAPPKAWRSEMRPVVRFVLDYFPKATNAEIARALHTECLFKEANVTTRTIENWLSVVRKLIA